MAAYLGLVSFMDAQVGRVLDALDAAGLRDATRILYTSDHGENAGKRGFWGKSNHYEEAVHIPLIIACEGVAAGAVCATPASLVDVHPTVLHCAGIPADGPADGPDLPGRSLFDLARAPDDAERVVFSEYHAAGSLSAAFMVRKERHKLIHYVGFEPELFDLEVDVHERSNLAGDPAYAGVLEGLRAILHGMLDPEETDRRANAAQRRLIEEMGGPEKVYDTVTGSGLLYTPAPGAA